MRFTKMQGIGNDYVYLNCLEQKIPDPEAMARFVSDRHFGVGADGLVLILPSARADFRMDMYNADGSRSQMCGNAIRCVGKYVRDRGFTGQNEITVETLAGIKQLQLHGKGGTVESVTVNMGRPELDPAKIPVAMKTPRCVNVPLAVDGEEYRITCVSMGNPHAVVFTSGVDDLNLEKIGPLFENHPLFPQRINTEFVEAGPDGGLNMRVWERGSGETMACGTGACAALVAAVLNGVSGREADIRLRGGALHIRWDEEDGCVYKTGPAAFVFDGELDPGAWERYQGWMLESGRL